MSDFLIYIGMYARLFFVSFSSTVMMFIVTRTIFPQKRSGSYFFIYWGYRFFVQEILITTIMGNYFRNELWFQLFYSVVTLVGCFLAFFVFWYVFEGELLNIVITALLVDTICGSVNMIVAMLIGIMEGEFYYVNLSGNFNWHDLLIPIGGMLIFYPVYRYCCPLLKRFGTYKIKRPHLCWGLIAGIITYAFFNNQLAIRALESVINSDSIIFRNASFLSICFIVAGIVILLLYNKMLRKKRAFFLKNKKQMEEYYSKINELMNQMKLQNESLNKDMEKFYELQSILETRGNTCVSSPSEDTIEWIEKYMKSLKNRYDSLKPILFCNDYAVDAILSHFAEKCQKNNVEADFQFQKYLRGVIDQEDILQIISKLLKYGWDAVNVPDINHKDKKWIQLHVAAIKNQLIFDLTASCMKNVRVKKKDFRCWIKKYDGILDVCWENEKLEIVLGLTKENICNM